MIHLSFLLSVGLLSGSGIQKGVTRLSTAFPQNRQTWVVKSQEPNIKREPDNKNSYFYNYYLNLTNGAFKNYANLYLVGSRPVFSLR